MSIRMGLLAVLAEEPMHAYEMRRRFERRTGGTWPLNMGQVSATLDSLERAGLIETVPGTDDAVRYRLTPRGGGTIEEWWFGAVDRTAPAREEITIKIALAVTAPGVDVERIMQVQRSETVRAMQQLTRLKAHTPDGVGERAELAWSLVLDHLLFVAEAETRWLDHVAARVRRAEQEAMRAGAHAPNAANASDVPAEAPPAGEPRTRGGRLER